MGWQPFWSVGLGFNNIDVEDLIGELNNANPYRVEIDAGEEIVIEVAGGFRYRYLPVHCCSIVLQTGQSLKQRLLKVSQSVTTPYTDCICL